MVFPVPIDEKRKERWLTMVEEEGSQLEEALRVRYFNGLPSPELLSTQIEPSNVPAVFREAVKEWDAFTKWNPRNGGLDYLQEQVGSNTVEAMLTRSAPVFYGDIRSHERIPLPFSTFIASCKSCENNVQGSGFGDDVQKPSATTSDISDEACSNSMPGSEHVYLAQVPIINIENKERSTLETLREDIQMPAFLGLKQLVSINFWMNNARSRSSTHYDPHNNLLCVVSGCKQVVLWPPSTCPVLYPMPIYGEASNHSAVDIESPDLSLHPRAKFSMIFSQKTILQAGDALFIPEGWFHQVDSDDLTIAVNFWWQSDMMSSMLEHMDAYYLRRIVNRKGNGQNQMLLRISSSELVAGESDLCSTDTPEGNNTSPSNSQSESGQCSQENCQILDNLTPFAVKALHRLVSLVHQNVNDDNQNQIVKATSSKDPEVNVQVEQECISTMKSRLLESDRVASFLWALEPLVLKKVLLAMVQSFPRTLEALILHMLSPTAAEVLTRKFDEMDRQTPKEQQKEFYQLLYSTFDDQFAAMDALLSGKELFAFQAFRNVLDQYLGANVDQPK